jgi:hypothetical protein
MAADLGARADVGGGGPRTNPLHSSGANISSPRVLQNRSLVRLAHHKPESGTRHAALEISTVGENCHYNSGLYPRSAFERVGTLPPMSVSRSASSMQGATLIALHEVVQKFGCWFHSGNQKMISRAGTGNVEQVPLSVVDFLQIGVVANCLDAFLQRNYFVVAGHHDNGPKLKTLGEVHGADRDVPVGGFNVFIENLESKARFLDGSARAIQLPRRPDEHAELVR